MKNILYINSSARGERSHSRRMAKLFLDGLLEKYPHSLVTEHDLTHEQLPLVTETWVAAAFTPEAARTAEMHQTLSMSDHLVDELIAADIVIIGSPMYNLTVPTSLKAWIDLIVRESRTFKFQPEVKEQPYKPLLQDKEMYIVTAKGDSGYDPGGAMGAYNFLEPYLQTVFKFLGIENVKTVSIENDEYGGLSLKESLARAQLHIQNQWLSA